MKNIAHLPDQSSGCIVAEYLYVACRQQRLLCDLSLFNVLNTFITFRCMRLL